MIISLVVPVYNEQDAIPIFYKSVREELAEFTIEIVFINDGSSDATESIINKLAADDYLIKALNFVRNFGKEAALIAGLESSTDDAIIPIDVDLQDPLHIIPLLIEEWKKGFDVVLAKRIDRTSDGTMKRVSAELFYKLHNMISKPRIVENVGDFRLMSREIVERIKLLPERNVFMKGILSWVEGEESIVEYTRMARISGVSKFNSWRLWNLALEGITSFSTVPLRIWTYVGVFVAFCSLIYGTLMLVKEILWGNVVPGYPSLIVSILFLGGIQLIGIGVLGEYIGRIYVEVKHRPRFILKKTKKP
ncbi:glycosyltransferase family 2 protein [Serratia sp. M24T3]|uniref:glycosyltransferase family 2 protein n=1 Tax=Serratia sp. M24T3 TaxID=932213 RepID=UPI00025B9176|nr:glycosyltransferase family 2 protein [Serratia sp. M24T3]EIC84054.1 bactoprenol glucosyl transferase [Serratia sp. M24T3]